MDRTITVEDTLNERVETANSEVQELIKDNLLESINETDEIDVDSVIDSVGEDLTEIADSNSPIYTKEIRDTWYLYHDDLISAYEDIGLGNDSNEMGGATAIYCYIEQKIRKNLYGLLRSKLEDYKEWREEAKHTNEEITKYINENFV